VISSDTPAFHQQVGEAYSPPAKHQPKKFNLIYIFKVKVGMMLSIFRLREKENYCSKFYISVFPVFSPLLLVSLAILKISWDLVWSFLNYQKVFNSSLQDIFLVCSMFIWNA
jgi:hypothetical protein